MINDKEKEYFVNEPKDDKPTDSGSGHKRKDGKKKKTRRIKEIVYYDNSDESSSSQKDDDNNYEKKKTVNSNSLSIILVFRIAQMHICFPFHLVNLLTCSLSILAYGR